MAFTSRDERGRYQIYVTDASNPGDPQPLLVNNQSKHHMDWSQDGKFLAYESGFEANSDVWVLPLEGDRKPYPVVATDFQEGMPQFSPDGSWLAYASNRTGRLEVYVQRFGQESKETIQISNAGGTSPRWRKDGRELCYGAADRYITCVPLGFEGSTLKPGKPIALFRTELIATALSAHFTMTADAQRFLVKHAGEGAQAQPLWVVLNWLDAASRQQ